MNWLRETQTWHAFGKWEDVKSNPARVRGLCGTVLAIGREDAQKRTMTDEGELPTTHLTCVQCAAMVASDDY